MKNLSLHEIRSEFLSFFEHKRHMILPSFSLVPKNDKSLLLIGAGMAPMKKYFTGELVPPSKRVATCQKCIRTGDIDNVGKTDRHATFFEMLGNFSFGDYFKREIIHWSWEFLTENLEIPEEDLWVTVYFEDDEAYNIWHDEIHVPEEKIIRLGKEDNFWELELGPSGPCSEIYVDRGLDYGSEEERPGGEGDRFIEVWNLVFTQFDKDEAGNYNPLSHPNIDTGMGLERIATVLQQTDNIFEIDAIREIIEAVEKISGYSYESDEEKDVSVRVITDHIRAITFLISDTVRPGNEGRGYVLRRLIRRGARHGRLLGVKESFLYKLADIVIDSWGDQYPELIKDKDTIKDVILREEERFLETIEQGIEILNDYIEKLQKEKKDILSGADAFKLYDTYGFPLDLTEEILSEKKLLVDRLGFEKYMEDQRERARAARGESNIGWSHHVDDSLYENFNNEFVGYEKEEVTANILAIIKDNQLVDQLNPGEKAVVIMDPTPFYGESGGQVGDTGFIYSKNFKLRVLDTKKTPRDLHLHIVEVEEGFPHKTSVTAVIDSKRRENIKRNHSVTHLLHKALREVLGTHVNQAGSEVMAERLRFDFTHFESISSEDLQKIENRVNEKIFECLPVKTTITTVEEAQKMGAIGLFEDKYTERVRVLSMGDYSMELCGGTHVQNTAEISMFKITSEGGISSGVRRIEAITGPYVYSYLKEMETRRDQIVRFLKTNKRDLFTKVQTILEELKKAHKEIESLQRSQAKDELDEILAQIQTKNDISFVTYSFQGIDMDTLREMADEVRGKIGSVVVLFSTVNEGKLSFVCAVSKDLVERGIQAGKLIKEIAKVAGGGGGGRPDMAMAGAKDIEKTEEALGTLEKLL
ncbi:MAG: alanine--tRNA ligase [Tissierellia bacterium]|nr:alanine--tRNA ligase [Tissierellia bacterium]